MEFYRTHKFTNDRRTIRYSKIPRKDPKKEVYFPLHNRSQLLGKDYSTLFERVFQLKIPLMKIETKRIKVSVQHDKYC